MEISQQKNTNNFFECKDLYLSTYVSLKGCENVNERTNLTHSDMTSRKCQI